MEMMSVVGLDDDLTRLDDLSESSILETLKRRYERNLVYTKVSDILIALNPCKDIGIYTEQYHEENGWEKFNVDAKPHVFDVAACAYRRMRESQTNQVIIVSGESGAGKTESTKHMVRHVVHMCQKDNMDLHDKIIKINPLLEAFGNAKTAMNRNSSRYAKYLELTFKEDGQLLGAVVRDYMIEKSRVVHQTRDEGNFHIFYALFAGAPKEKLETELCLNKHAAEYRITCSDEERLSLGTHYSEMYKEIMGTLGQIEVDTQIVHMLLAAVVHLSEVAFSESENGVAQINDKAPYSSAAQLLGLDEESLAHALITSKVNIRGQDIVTYKTVVQAEESRDALAKMLYERLFGWLVRQININLHPHRRAQMTSGSISLGILDIAGFEKLRHNSLEQMCINIVNEKLQFFMNEKLFSIELRIYREEGIELDNIHFKNNEKTIQIFIEKKRGILATLDEQTKLQHGSDGAFVHAITEQLKSNELFSRPKGDHPEFAIQHFAALVMYSADGFVEKNRDTLNLELLDVMKKSKDEFISDLFTVKRGPTGTISTTVKGYRASRMSRMGVKVLPKPKVPNPNAQVLAAELGKSLKNRYGTIGQPVSSGMGQITAPKDHKTLVSYFQHSLVDLLDKLAGAEPFFVRCLKPNFELMPDNFHDSIVKDQLRYNGISEVAKIRKMGFSVRKSYTDFNEMYSLLLPSGERRGRTRQDTAKKILLLTPAEYHRDFKCGKNKVFMKEAVNIWLAKFKHIRESSAGRIIQNFIIDLGELKRKQREEERRRQIEAERQRREEERLREEERRIKEKDAAETAPKTVSFTAKGDGADDDKGGNSSRRSLGSILGDYNRVPPRVTEPVRPPSPAESESPAEDYDTDDQDDQRPPSPPREHDLDDNSLSAKKKKKMEKEKEKIAFWDVCQVVSREIKVKDVHEERSMQVVKVITYFIIFCFVLFCAVSQKLSLMIMVSPQYKKFVGGNRTDPLQPGEGLEEDTVTARYVLLLIAMLIPYGLILVTSLLKWIFGTFPTPLKSTILVVGLMEGLHTVGLSLLCFKILPELDMVNGIMLLSATALIPAILKPVCSSESSRRHQTVGIFVVDMFCIIAQISAIALLVAAEYQYFIDQPLESADEWPRIVESVFAVFLVSFSWWETFVDDRFCGRLRQNSCWQKFVMKTKFDLQESRPIITTFSSVWKIGLSILLAWVFRMEISEQFVDAMATLNGKNVKHNAAILTLTLAGYVGNYFAYIACKLQLQLFSFTLPLILATPIAVTMAILDCDYQYLDVVTTESRSCINHWAGDADTNWLSADQHGAVHWWHLLLGAVWWISLYWVARHIFYPAQERLAKVDRLFLNPFYCGILLETHLLLNRRRHNRKIKREIKDDKISYRLSKYDTKMSIEGKEEDHEEETSGQYKPLSDKDTETPMIYACATMWHETRREMTQLMKSIFRVDKDQCLRRHAELLTGKKDPDFYDFEAHILFDDAMELNDDGEMVPNQFVKLALSVFEEAASSVYERHIKIKDPTKVPTPYGGQLIWQMPGDNFLFLHMKDKNKIRHRKRWSQVMYMYYLLGFRIVRMCQETVTAALNEGTLNELLSWDKRQMMTVGEVGKSHIFQSFDEQVQRKAANTFILALDGDVDFTPGAVRLLLDRMRKSEKAGAACGRIHPIGAGPVVWFQKFEYATAHWLQKATEHVLGCVLCSPGCFSLFRGSALMDDNVMRKYTIRPTEASHHLMYDQGEDRWLCTLLLQQGYRVDYAAASDAYTYAPEGFGEFFNQRRRWMPSTVANILDLLADYKNTVHINSNISILYIMYQFALLISTIVGPATVIMMLAGASLIVFKVNLWQSYLIALLPAVFYFILCFLVKPKWQIFVAEIMSALYAFMMMIVFVGTLVAALEESPFHPSVIFIAVLVFIFAFAAALHPKEWSCAVYGILYFLLVPTGFLLLIIYSLANLHNVSWGTREVPKKKTKEEIEEEKRIEEEKKKKKQERGFFGRLFPEAPFKDMKDIIGKITDLQGSKKGDDENTKLLQEISQGISMLVQHQSGDEATKQGTEKVHPTSDAEAPHVKSSLKRAPSEKKKSVGFKETVSRGDGVSDDVKEEAIYDKLPKKRDELKNPRWIEEEELGDGDIMIMLDEEKTFWEGFIKKYLYPLEMSGQEKKAVSDSLIELRNNACLGMAMINIMWIAINFMFQLSEPTKISLSFQSADELDEESDQVVDEELIKVDILGLLFIVFFVVVLVIQFIGMISHRWGTFLHLISITQLSNPFKGVKEPDIEVGSDTKTMKPGEAKQTLEIVESIFHEPLPDYSDDDGFEEEEREEKKEELKRLMTTGARFRLTGKAEMLGTSTRMLGMSERRNFAQSSNLRATARAYGDGLRARGKHDEAPKFAKLQEQLNDGMRKQADSKYRDRQLPPIKQTRLNLGPGQEELFKRLKERRLTERLGLDRDQGSHDTGGARPYIPEGNDDDDVYDCIPGTLGRKIGKRLKVMAKLSPDARDQSTYNGTPRSNRRPVSAEMY